MGLGFKRTSAPPGDIPVFQGTYHLLAQGGFKLDITGLKTGTYIPKGYPMSFDESTRIAKLVKAAKVVEAVGGSGTAIKVAKGHQFVQGDFVLKATGSASYAISSIVTTDPSFDTINVATTLGALALGEYIFQAAASGASGSAFIVAPKGVLYSDQLVEENEAVSVKIAGDPVYARRVPYSASLEAALPRIIYSQSF